MSFGMRWKHRSDPRNVKKRQETVKTPWFQIPCFTDRWKPQPGLCTSPTFAASSCHGIWKWHVESSDKRPTPEPACYHAFFLASGGPRTGGSPRSMSCNACPHVGQLQTISIRALRRRNNYSLWERAQDTKAISIPTSHMDPNKVLWCSDLKDCERPVFYSRPPSTA